MSKRIGITTPLVSVEYAWEKEIKDISKKEYAENVLDSFLIAEESGEKLSLDEITRFCEALRNNGHLAKFKGETKEKYKTLVKIKNQKEREKEKEFEVYLGTWKSFHSFEGGYRPSYQVILNMVLNAGGNLECKGNISFEEYYEAGSFRYELMEDFYIMINDSGMHLTGTSVIVTKGGIHSGKNNNYIFDIFHLTFEKDQKNLQGTHIRPQGQVKVVFNKIS